jgi:hypothetical protein
LATIGKYEYYFYKSIYSVLIFSLALFFLGTFELATWIYNRSGRWRFLLPSIILAATIVIANATNLVYLKVYVHNWYPSAVQPADLDVLFTPTINSYKDVLFVGSCNVARNYLENRWSGAQLLSESTWRSPIEVAGLNENFNSEGKLLAKYIPRASKVLLIVYPDCSHKIPSLTSIEQRSNVTVIQET